MSRAFEMEEPIGLLAIDLDRFKALNDGLGHHVGDRLLIEFGERLVEALPDAQLIARIGGDEFAVLIRTDRLVHAATRIDAALALPFVLDGLELHIGAIPAAGRHRAPPDRRRRGAGNTRPAACCSRTRSSRSPRTSG